MTKSQPHTSQPAAAVRVFLYSTSQPRLSISSKCACRSPWCVCVHVPTKYEVNSQIHDVIMDPSNSFHAIFARNHRWSHLWWMHSSFLDGHVSETLGASDTTRTKPQDRCWHKDAVRINRTGFTTWLAQCCWLALYTADWQSKKSTTVVLPINRRSGANHKDQQLLITFGY